MGAEELKNGRKPKIWKRRRDQKLGLLKHEKLGFEEFGDFRNVWRAAFAEIGFVRRRVGDGDGGFVFIGEDEGGGKLKGN